MLAVDTTLLSPTGAADTRPWNVSDNGVQLAPTAPLTAQPLAGGGVTTGTTPYTTPDTASVTAGATATPLVQNVSGRATTIAPPTHVTLDPVTGQNVDVARATVPALTHQTVFAILALAAAALLLT